MWPYDPILTVAQMIPSDQSRHMRAGSETVAAALAISAKVDGLGSGCLGELQALYDNQMIIWAFLPIGGLISESLYEDPT